MHDIALIHSNPEAFDAGLKSRGLEGQATHLIALDDERRKAISWLQKAREKRNALADQMGRSKQHGDVLSEEDKELIRQASASLKRTIEEAERNEQEATRALEQALSSLPHLPLSDVPIGPDGTYNREDRRVGRPPSFTVPPQEHFILGEKLGGMDFEASARLSGARFCVLKGDIARLERALGQFMLDLHTEHHGYTEVSPPLLVRGTTLFGTGQLPKFANDQFATSDDLWLIPTSEVPLTNLVRDSIVKREDLPFRFTALTPCFRREAGSAGRDVRGILRQHQFYKVELVSITTPEASLTELERMVSCAEEVLKRLELPYRVMTLCTGDMGFSSCKTYDIEVWLPGQNTYREISSCSLCGDFQARRMNARYRDSTHLSGRKLPFLHTLNGSGVAVGRALIAVIENGQNADGSISIPSALQPYMGGITRLRAENFPPF